MYKSEKYEPVIGMEIHVELSTKSKMFCGCKNDPFGAEKPNIYTCPICLGLPGALPVPNKKAIDWTIMIGLALNCKIAENSKFDRKHYFYPDLPKGYQISQYDEPLCFDGSVATSKGDVRITRVHLEEDTGKLKHAKVDGKNVSLIDFNRGGVPLVEIVTEPDLVDSEHAKEFLKKVHAIIKALEVSDASMETGSMRLEANISLKKKSEKELPDYKVEVKNLNSFRFVSQAIDYDLKRQEEILRKGETPKQETRGWSEDGNKTLGQRFKETSADYRYFPDPDIPPLEISKKQIEEIKNNMNKTPDEYEKEFLSMGMRKDYARLVSINPETSKFLLSAIEIAKSENIEVDQLLSEIVNKRPDEKWVTKEDLINHIKRKKKSVKGEDVLEPIVKEVLIENKGAVDDYKKGKTNAVGFLVGQVMAKTKGKADAKITAKLIEKLIK